MGTIAYSQTVTVGTQVWNIKNLDVTTFRNGDPIPQAKTDEEWLKAGNNKQPAWCYYDNDPANGSKYGKLYNWYAVNDSRGLAPKGFHIPSDAEWRLLYKYLGGFNVAGIKIKSSIGWSENGNGTNDSGFSGLPGGNRSYEGTLYGLNKIGDGIFKSIGITARWWSSTDGGGSYANLYSLNLLGESFFGTNYKGYGMSVRCLKD